MATSALTDICLDTTRAGAVTRFHCRIPADFRGFEGHFDNNPILPGVFQLKLVTDGIALIDAPPKIDRIERMKFHNLILPDTEFVIELEKQSSGWAYRLHENDKVYSSGKIILR